MRKIKVLLLAVALSLPVTLGADEGLWLIQDLNSNLMKAMRERGIKLHAKQIYDVDSPGVGVANAVVSLGFRYSGSFVSDRGLILTSHVPATTFLEKVGDVGKDLLRDGFWAVNEQQEIPVKGEKVYSLKQVVDITEELKVLARQLGDTDRAAHRLEKSYSDLTGLTCYVSVYWGGERSFVSAYKVYDDVRLVAVPPASAAQPGGVSEDWSWPVSRCDFSLYRVYEDGRPANTRDNCLLVSLDGYLKGSFTAVAGFPGYTERNISHSESMFRNRVSMPLSHSMEEERLKILEKWIADDPGAKARYSAREERLKDRLERESAGLDLGGRYGLMERRESRDQEMRKRISRDPALAGLWTGLLPEMDEAYDHIAEGERDRILRRETMVDGTFAGDYLFRAASADSPENASQIIFTALKEIDPKVEKDLLAYSISEYFTNVDMCYYGPYQKWIQDRFGYDWAAAADYLWSKSYLASPEKVSLMESVDDFKSDALLMFLSDSPRGLYDSRDGEDPTLKELDGFKTEYQKALYWTAFRNDEPGYPDGDSSMRWGYGVTDDVFTIPADALTVGTHGTRWRNAIEKDFWGRWGFTVRGKRHRMVSSFLSDNDFVNGMEGAPVFDARGRLIGVVSGGNAESKAGRDAYFEGSSKTICTDIRYIVWCLDRYAGLKRIVKEFEFI